MSNTDLPTESFDLDQPIVQLTQTDALSMRDTLSGVFVAGQTGSGKTSGPGRTLAEAMLVHGYGGLVITAKRDERDFWIDLAKRTGRSRSVLVISPENKIPFRYNFLDVQTRLPVVGGSMVENVVRLFHTVLEVCNRSAKQGSGGENAKFWQDSADELLRNAIVLLQYAGEPVTLDAISRVIQSAPDTSRDLQQPAWLQWSYCYKLIDQTLVRLGGKGKSREFDMCGHYFLGTFPSIPDKQRGAVVTTLLAPMDIMMRGWFNKLFSTRTTWLPELCFEGVITICDFPPLVHGEAGIMASTILRHCFQRAVLRRSAATSPRPVFLWCDEYQLTATAFDVEYQSVARSHLAASVFMTQSLSTLYASLGGEKSAENQANSLIGNLAVKLFCSNGDATTNLFAADLVGKDWLTRLSSSTGRSHNTLDVLGKGMHNSTSTSDHMEHVLPPKIWTTLRQGGPNNDHHVDTILIQPGRIFQQTQRPYAIVSFDQNV